MKRTIRFVPLALVVVLLAGCVGGKSQVNRSEIESFFALYEHRMERQDVDGLTSMYQLPVTFTAFTESGSPLELEINSANELKAVLASLVYANDDYYEYELLDSRVIVVNVSGSGNKARASIIREVQVKHLYSNEVEKDIYEVDVTLEKVGSSWKIRAEHFVSVTFE